jgi:hypothetical protein
MYWGADNSLARSTSRCILFDGENISFDASLVIYTYINSTNIPPIVIINRIYEHQNRLSLYCFLPGRAKDLSALLYMYRGADNSLARSTSRYILFDYENISFDAGLLYI